jgi:PRTRC genetic system protein E
METNFFTQVAGLQLVGDLILSIRTLPDEKLTISAFLKNDDCTDPAKRRITPFIATVKAEELDREFFDKLTEPLQAVSSLLQNMVAFNKQVEESKAALANKNKKTNSAAQEDPKIKRFNEAMKKVEELDEQGKPRQALAALPDPAEYPEHFEAIEDKRKTLTEKFAPELF